MNTKLVKLHEQSLEKKISLENTKTIVQEKTKQIKKRFSLHNLLYKKSFKRT